MAVNVLIQGSGGGGQKLAPLTTPASADKVKSGKELYDASGTKITGSYTDTLPTLNAPTITVSDNVVNIVDGDNGNFSKTWEIRINNLPYRIIAHTGNYTFTELADGTYTVKVCARGDGFNDSAFSNVETMTISTSSPIYGVSGLTNSSPTLTRTDNAVGMTWTMSNNEISSDFDSVFPYNQMVKETIGENVFVKIPAIWWRIGYDSNNYITDVAVSETQMTAGANQVVAQTDAFYFGAYKGRSTSSSNPLVSKSGVAPTYNLSWAGAYDRALLNGSGYNLIRYRQVCIINLLFLIEFATKNSDSVMHGYTSTTGTTGATDNLTTPSGQLAVNGRMRYRYIEDYVGNGFEWMNGIFGNQVYSKTGTGYTFTVGGAGSGNELAAIAIVDMNDPTTYAPAYTVLNESYDTYFCDYVVIGQYDYMRGHYSSFPRYGIFFIQSPTSGSNTYRGSRLMYIPPSA